MRHYTTRHSAYEQYSGRDRQEKYDSLSFNLQQQQQNFIRYIEISEKATKCSLAIAQLIGQRQLPFQHGEFAKEALAVFVDEFCSDKKSNLESVALSRTTIARRVENLSKDIEEHQQNGQYVEVNSRQYAYILSDLSADIERRFFQFAETEKKIKISSLVKPLPLIVNPSSVAAELQMELIDLQADKRLKQHFSHELIEFYHDFFSAGTYPALHKHALRMVSLFGSTYLCEQFFSRMKHTKSKYRTGLTDEHLAQQLRVSFSDTKPDLDRIVREKQYQVAH
ncbi:EPM2A-interacting protein 1-like [Watersipora subatra]|uniref:EPM2A-interacting protein 1-like n=1 Tax=Watersipora subatra TaxID=2589382 RepID=UPI00355C58B1